MLSAIPRIGFFLYVSENIKFILRCEMRHPVNVRLDRARRFPFVDGVRPWSKAVAGRHFKGRVVYPGTFRINLQIQGLFLQA
jgi:hypothetical protein